MNRLTHSLPFVRAAGSLAALMGMFVLAGWVFDVSAFKSVLRGAVEMKANTAAGLVCAGASLCLLSDHSARAYQVMGRFLGLVVAALGLLTLGEYAFGWPLGIDQLLFRDSAVAYNLIPGRMSPYSALAFAAIGGSLAGLTNTRMAPMVRSFAALATVIGVVGVIGYLWHASELVTDDLAPPIAVHSALAFALLGAATLLTSRGKAPRPLPHDDATEMTPAGDGSARTSTRVSIENKAAIGFIAAAALLAVGGGITYRTCANYVESSQWVVHTEETRAQLGQLYAMASDAESAARGFLLTGMPRHVEAYARLAADARKRMAELRRHVADNGAQLLLAQKLESELQRRLASLDAQTSASDDQRARNRAVMDDDVGALDTLRHITQQMDDAEASMLADREAQANRSRQQALLFLLLTLVWASAIFIFLFLSIRREVRARGEADERLRRLNTELELRVQERTTELSHNAMVYRHTLDNMIEGCQIIGFDWRYQYVNEAAAVHGKSTKDLMVGRRLGEVYPGIEATDVFSRLRRCMEDRLPQVTETEFKFPDGSRGWFHMSILPAPEGISVFSVDVTSRRRAEDEIRAINADLERRVADRTTELVLAREAAESASRAKSAFLATMSHEIRTPMNGVIGMLDVLTHSKLSPTENDAVKTIRTSAFSLLDIIDDILDFSKIEAGRLDLERAPVDLPGLVDSIRATLQPVAVGKGVSLSLDIDSRVPAFVWSDATRLRQVVFNLAGNAIKFSAGLSKRRGQVSIRVDVSDTDQPAAIVLAVADNGIGMTGETLSRLFTSFTQAESSTTRRFGGTGLGLAICQRLVTLMHGQIDVKSAIGQGSTFTVTLPFEAVDLADARQSIEAPPPALVNRISGRRILIAEDDEVNQKVISRQLELLGHDAVIANNGADALSLWRSGDFALLLTDLHMPDMDGYTLADAIRREESARGVLHDRRMPILALTANAIRGEAVRAQAAGMDEYLTKPLQMTLLREALERWMV